ncbi:protein of unknown function [bacterium A37T11]|nr:protein of unknown function [bacterium A37T11]
MLINAKNLLFLCMTALLPLCSLAQKKPVVDTVKTADTTKKEAPPKKPEKPPVIKPYGEVITDKAITKKGLIMIHKVDDKYFFELDDKVLNKDMLVIARLSKSGADVRSGFTGYAGDQVNENVIRFEKGPEDKIFLRKISFSEFSRDTTMPMYRSVMNSNIQPIAASFDIKAFSKDSTASVIDVTDFLKGDNDVLFFDQGAKSSLKLGGFQADKSYISGVNSYPMNTEIKTVKTYSRSGGGQMGPMGPMGGGGGTATVELNSSLVMLPQNQMQARYFDNRVGYFAVGYTDFDKDPQGVEKVSLIKRWRLEPKDMAAYKRGELVEPQKPIIFYIDPATPKKWVPYLILGVNDWQAAFEKAGFKNAIFAREAPTKAQDSTWSLEDARYSAIVYKPSAIANAMGPSIADPRTGEILESHVSWYHNVMKLVHDWYFIQTAAVDKNARKMEFSDELMGQLIRFVSSHEIGHTLGLRHNFGSSSTVPVENLRNKKWVEANGHTPSIMDYARFNYVAQPEDNISEKGLFPRIGAYDKWAIEWGYRLFPKFAGPEEERGYLNKWVIEKSKNPFLWFGTESNPDDPHSQNEDLGNDAMLASDYGIKNLKRIIVNLSEWTREDNKDYTSLEGMYGELVGQYMRYMGHVAKNIGGIYEVPKTVEQEGDVYTYVPKATQQRAVAFINNQLFTTPDWLIDKEVFNKTGDDPYKIIGDNQTKVLGSLLNTGRMQKLISSEAKLGAEAYTLTNLFDDVQGEVWKELATKEPVSVYRRNLQKSYIDNLDKIVSPKSGAASSSASPMIMMMMASGGNAANSDVISVSKGYLKKLQADIAAAIPSVNDNMTKLHLQDCLERIQKVFKPE